jgi:DNA-binding transcriptional ArsR family regulator
MSDGIRNMTAGQSIASSQIMGILKAIAHPIRFEIIYLLCDHELHVGAIAETLSVKQPIISQQLRILRMNHLVESSRRQGLAVYRLSIPGLRKLVDCINTCTWEPQGQRDE